MKNYWLRRKEIREDAAVTYPNIYGLVSCKRHMPKFTDDYQRGRDAAHNAAWKRIETLATNSFLLWKGK